MDQGSSTGAAPPDSPPHSASLAPPPNTQGPRSARSQSGTSSAHRVHYDMSIDTQNLSPPRMSDPRGPQSSRSETDVPVVAAAAAGGESYSPILRRRSTRANTLKTVEDYDEFDATFSGRPGWQPGSEPGYDPRLPDGGHASMPALNAPCNITVVDFSLDQILPRHFENESFVQFLEQPKPEWAKCRWINVNGLSWDVIQAVGKHKGLHKLALEDVMNIRNRTKADWYPNHAFIIMTLQKLVHLEEDDDDDSTSDSSSVYSRKSTGSILKQLVKGFARRRRPSVTDAEKFLGRGHGSHGGGMPTFSDGTKLHETTMMRTLQRYHASGNEARTEFMEAHSSLAPYKMAVSAEQVSIFLTNDNTVISFFEVSAGDIERPIVKRLDTKGTILRESCDASLLVQAIIDAIIDLAIPLTAVYTDIIGDLELDVLTAPSMKQSRSLYICISEINNMLRFLNPIDNLVSVLRDHRTYLTQEQATTQLESTASGVIVTPMTHTYLGDVLDHCIIITEALAQLKQSSENLISLIFNTISANQNESMKQLTFVTIIFLPLTFITGFFGQNFEGVFPEIHYGIWYFWACAVPTALATIIILMRDMIYAWAVRVVQRKHILSIREKKRHRQKK